MMAAKQTALSERQLDVLNCIKEHVQANGYPPTTREIGEILNMKSTSTVHQHLGRLRDKGYVDWIDGAPRTLRIVK
ncbi:LexA family protein [Alicyclobacillus dauci]|uniref:Winged helix-turn-helix transcriptional regulator n=1 Tax=Alicyclobacillus dauci TaxID=1475485 RepID=A0ABY6YY46_9BACL|nr:winged helix-turn-helix transcriptional regulator [Alicyclobacillus dauci]WAH35031.1 winged helix-turn-helix transcriptional regulator [Alicyclobacillus dauci]